MDGLLGVAYGLDHSLIPDLLRTSEWMDGWIDGRKTYWC